MTAGLPAGRKLIVDLIADLLTKKSPRHWGREEREQGEQQRPDRARAYRLHCLPADTGYCTRERTI
jgi:hypothetical protein